VRSRITKGWETLKNPKTIENIENGKKNPSKEEERRNEVSPHRSCWIFMINGQD